MEVRKRVENDGRRGIDTDLTVQHARQEGVTSKEEHRCAGRATKAGRMYHDHSRQRATDKHTHTTYFALFLVSPLWVSPLVVIQCLVVAIVVVVVVVAIVVSSPPLHVAACLRRVRSCPNLH
jgi:Flp pilus assembly protein TadB